MQTKRIRSYGTLASAGLLNGDDRKSDAAAKMIGKLKGIIDSHGEDFVILDVQGVGYIVHCSGRTLQKLPPAGEAATLAIETQMREDSIRLFGFVSETERHWFRLLLIGARCRRQGRSRDSNRSRCRRTRCGDRLPGQSGDRPGARGRSEARGADRLGIKGQGGVRRSTRRPPSLPEWMAASPPPRMTRSRLSSISAMAGRRPSAAVAASMAALGAGAPASDLIRQGLKELTR